MSRVIVIGGASFIGSHLVENLLRLGHEVVVLDNFSTGNQDHLSGVKDDIEIITGEAEDTGLLRRALNGGDVLFHLAAKHGGRGYIESHELDCLSNIGLDHNVFRGAGGAGIGKIIYASSACVYPTNLQREKTWLKETDAGWKEPGGAFADGAYGWAKLIGEMQLETVGREYGIDVAAARIFTVYGERENLTHALPALVDKAMRKMDPFPVWGDGEQTRNFTYVGDTVKGLLNLLGREENSTVNVGLREHISINELLEAIFHLLDWRPEEIEYQKDAPVGVRYRASDNTLSRELFSWEPDTPLPEGLRKTIEFMEK